MSSTDPQKLDVQNISNQFIFTGYISAHDGIYFVEDFKSKVPTKVSNDLSTLFTTQIVQFENNIPCHTFHIYKSKTINQN